MRKILTKDCCGCQPVLKLEWLGLTDLCYFSCAICGKRTKGCLMPWLAAEDWNSDRFVGEGIQLSFFKE